MSSRQKIALAAIAALTALAGALNFADAPAVARFVAAAVALAGLAWIVAFATEQVGEHFGPAMTGFLQSTLGNLPEFFVVIFALGAGEIVVAQTSLIGSLLANALLVLGITIVAGARESSDGLMRFSARLPNDATTLLLLATFTIVVLGVAISAGEGAGEHAKAISTVGAIALLIVYAVWIRSYLRSDPPESGDEAPAAGGRAPMSLRWAIVLLALAGVGSAFVSDWFISALDPAVEDLGISKAFAGLIIVAIAGNAVENATAVILASKGRADLAISVVKNSVAQIAAFLYPALILVSLLFATPLTFAIDPVYIAALAAAAIAVWQITGDGEARTHEGAALIGLYAVVATVAWYQ